MVPEQYASMIGILYDRVRAPSIRNYNVLVQLLCTWTFFHLEKLPQLVTSLATRLTIPCPIRIRAPSIPQALRNRNQLQIIRLRPVDQPRRERLHRPLVRLVHQRDMSVAAGPRSLELGLALRRRLAVPVLGVDVVGDDAVPEGLHRREHAAGCLEVGRAHVGGFHADDVDEGGLELRHLGGEGGGGERADVRVRPGVRGDLVAGLVGILEGGFLVVDAAWC
jgi:hypothetical protein